jgi:ParB/RepB/Spo0J family partition protein
MAKAKKKTDTEPGAPPAAASDALPAESRNLAYRQLVPSPLNPRKNFDAEELAGLKSNIAGEGILQNLLVRRTVDPEVFEIVAGERRWRAVGMLVQEGVWGAEKERIPAVIRSLTDAQVLALAVIENVQRRDIDPVEEGRAFVQLREFAPAEWTTAAIAAAIGKTQRHVQKRIQLVERLAEPVASALSKGEINLEQAKALALGEQKMQREVLRAIKQGHSWQSRPEQIRQTMVEQLIPVSRAAFDLSQYTGEFIEVDENDENDRSAGRYFADAAEFKRLQDAAIEAKAAALREKWPWVDILGEDDNPHAYERVGKKHPKAGAVIFFDYNDRLSVAESVLRHVDAADERKGARSDRSTKPKKKTKPEDLRWLTQAQVQRVKQAKTLALRRALSDNPKAGLAVAILAMVGSRDIDVDIPGEWQSRARYLALEAPKPEMLERERRLAKLIAALPGKQDRRYVANGKNPDLNEDALAGAFEALMELEVDELLGILAVAAAPRVGAWMDDKAGDDPFALALAKATGAYERLDGLWRPAPEYFQAYRRDTLQALAIANGLGDGFSKLKKSEQVALLAQQDFWTWRHFAELQFLDDKAMQMAMAGPALMVPRLAPPAAAADALAEEMRCRSCGAAALRKHKKGCALAGEGKVSAASCSAEAPVATEIEITTGAVAQEEETLDHADALAEFAGEAAGDEAAL